MNLSFLNYLKYRIIINNLNDIKYIVGNIQSFQGEEYLLEINFVKDFSQSKRFNMIFYYLIREYLQIS